MQDETKADSYVIIKHFNDTFGYFLWKETWVDWKLLQANISQVKFPNTNETGNPVSEVGYIKNWSEY